MKVGLRSFIRMDRKVASVWLVLRSGFAPWLLAEAFVGINNELELVTSYG